MQHRLGGWLPNDQNVLEKWLAKVIAYVEHPSRINREFHPVIKEFKDFIESDPVIYMGFHQMFEQIPDKPPYNDNPKGEGNPQVRNYMCMLRLFNHIITTAPEYEENDLVGFPINAILDWPMGTPAGLAMFCDPRVNEMFKKMFYSWSAFLTTSDSRYVLTDSANGWFGLQASIALPNFDTTFVCDPTAPYHGYVSWDDFFTRRFQEGVRPIILADNNDVVNNACESTIYRIQPNVKASDHFWIKGEPYNLRYMLNNDSSAELFVGGTIYQAFLSALSYHRWHSPVNGRIVRTEMVSGTYYAESPTMGFQYEVGDDGVPVPDPAGPNNSQAFITSTAARAIIYIQADNPAIGLMCFMAVGMAEVSTCEITVRTGQTVAKGDQLGMFHFGGSTHCLIFRPETKITFDPSLPTDSNIPLNSAIATVEPL
ncbi:hypothetical protein PHLGIDRAFT_73618 [Phlebiopsis gigantea 11061_1 CR5-6]|uniref:L-tryptophan decarboxylase PsiD-like domain-containing protein n=1 Tax=Phlebiopsis gigantea (strain 11061_1 CR5-6) TaxID=745531 RepID=A0A0C3S939_PHLG1|nr:hypothetical protein PHLGIDRAFT_73618 [Phlebiopsis gigantea 11061_1 CR5-6]